MWHVAKLGGLDLLFVGGDTPHHASLSMVKGVVKLGLRMLFCPTVCLHIIDGIYMALGQGA